MDFSSFLTVLLLIVVAGVAFVLYQQDKTKSGKGRGPSSATFKKIDDQYESIEQVQEALRKAGLESSQMILGIGEH
jgi:hypothetical protein